MVERSTTLPNGFRVVSEHMPGLKSASLGIWVGVGCRHETQAQNGIAHFLEHMAFKGTKKRTALEIVETIENVGGYLNAYTSREMTAYYARVLENDVPLALDVVFDIILNSIFDSRELETERGVILQEIGQSLDTPDDIIFDWLQETAYYNQPIGRPILGKADLVRGFLADDLHDFINAHYTPDRMVLCAAGAVDHDRLVDFARSAFDDFSNASDLKLLPAHFIGGEKRIEKPLEQAHFALSMETVSYTDDKIYIAQVFSSILGGGMSSRLFQEVREKRGLCYSISASLGAFADSGMMTIYAGTSSNDIYDLSNLVIDQIGHLISNVKESELKRAKTEMKAGLVMGLEDVATRCERLARSTLIFNKVPSLDDVVDKIDRIDIHSIQNYAQQLLTSPMAMALYGPVSSAPELSVLQRRLAL